MKHKTTETNFKKFNLTLTTKILLIQRVTDAILV